MHRFYFILLSAIIVTGLAPSTSLGLRSAQAQGGNLLQNPDFESGFYTFNPSDYDWLALHGSQLADCGGPCSNVEAPNEWIPWWISQTEDDPEWDNLQPEYAAVTAASASNRVHSGSSAVRYSTPDGAHTAGLLQMVDVEPGARLRFTAWGQALSSTEESGTSTSPTTVNMRIGIDPTGGTSPYSGNIVWSSYGQPYDVYRQFVVEAEAEAERVTIFTISAPDEARARNSIYWDSTQLRVVPEGAPTVTPPPGTPTATPDAEGVIYAEVQEGDSFWSIAARHGLTLEELLELNDASRDDFLQLGQLLIVGYGSASTTDEADEAESAGEGSDGQATDDETAALATAVAVSPTPTPPLPTATATPARAEICLAAFADLNQNGLREEDEPLQSAVAFTISRDETVVSNYVTDGVSEPYCITGLQPGDYRITRSTAQNEVLTTAGDWTVTVEMGSSQTLEFGSYRSEELAAAPEEEPLDSAPEETPNEAVITDADSNGVGGGVTNILLSAAVVIAVLLLVGVLVVILSARRSTP
ncbi:MAG: LysM domain-containing protein [Candidatus Promineifilaceae bacterium]|nr:LysM domain-containing protein [Candidatus Promineifilaceae bacterium]